MIAVPYHLGRRGVEVGRGPLVILDALKQPCVVIEGDGIADVNAKLAQAVAAHSRPTLVLAGNCNSCLGTLAGLGDNPGIVWFDAHGDFNTPETTISGALEGMSLAIATGHCHPELMTAAGGGRKRHPGRDAQPGSAGRSPPASSRILNSLRSMHSHLKLIGSLRASSTIYMHLDLDVLDPSVSPGVNFSEPGGISPDQLFGAVRQVMATGKLGAAAIANFNPDRDRDGRTLRITQELVRILLAADERG